MVSPDETNRAPTAADSEQNRGRARAELATLWSGVNNESGRSLPSPSHLHMWSFQQVKHVTAELGSAGMHCNFKEEADEARPASEEDESICIHMSPRICLIFWSSKIGKKFNKADVEISDIYKTSIAKDFT